MEDNKNFNMGPVQDGDSPKTGVNTCNIDPIVDLTMKMIQTLDHINNFIKQLEEEERGTEGANETSSQGFLTGPEYNSVDAIQNQLMQQVMLGADIVDKLLSRESDLDALVQDSSCKDAGEAATTVREEMPDVSGQESNPELSSVSREALPESISVELVDKEDGLSEKQQPLEKSTVTWTVGSGKTKMAQSLEKLQTHVNNTLKLQQVNHEISLLLNRVVLCLNKRAMKKLQLETARLQAAGEEDAQPEPIISASLATSETSLPEPCQVDPGEIPEDKDIQDNEEDEDEGVEKGDTEKSEGEIEDFSSADGGESFTTTTEDDDDDVSSLASSVGDESSVNVRNTPAINIFTEHLHTDGIDIHFQQLSSKSHHNRQRCILKGTLLGITGDYISLDLGNIGTDLKVSSSAGYASVEGSGPNKRVAKKKITNYLLQEIIKKQKEGTLAPELTPFTNQELQDMAPFLCKQQEDYINQLQHQCFKLKFPHPHFSLIAKPDVNNQTTFHVECSALSLTATGTGETKRAARRMAAKGILESYENQNQES